MLTLGVGVAITSTRNNWGGDLPPPPPPPPPASFSPADLWLASESGGAWDASDLSIQRIARDGTGAAPGSGDPVGYVNDLGPNGEALEAPSDSARAIVVDVADRTGWRLDGLQDFFRTVNAMTGPSATTIMAVTSIVPSSSGNGLISLDSTVGGNSGTYRLISANSSEFRGRLRADDLPELSAQATGFSGVITLEWDFTAGTVTLRNNGTELTSARGYTTAMSDAQMIFGASRTQVSPIACDIGAIIHIGRVLTPAELADAEAWATDRLL